MEESSVGVFSLTECFFATSSIIREGPPTPHMTVVKQSKLARSFGTSEHD